MMLLLGTKNGMKANSAYAKYVKPAAAYTPVHADKAIKHDARSKYDKTTREDARIRALDNKIKALREQQQQQHHRIDASEREHQNMQNKESRGEKEKRGSQASSKSFGADEGLLNSRVDGEMFPSVAGPNTSSKSRKGWTVSARVGERGK
jgi:TolA-binding protein